uniref:Uncharacterized protein n=1 Tax=Glossina brevipalpis TaxID=37001 RepID=A0A1A9WLQ1_9MUSC
METLIKFLMYHYVIKYYILTLTVWGRFSDSVNCSNDINFNATNSNGNYCNNDLLKLHNFYETINKNLQFESSADNDLVSIKNSTQSRAKKAYTTSESSSRNDIIPGTRLTHSFSLSPSSSSSLSPMSSSVSLTQQQQQAQQHLLSRQKRYLSFPEGSSFSVAVCFTIGIIGNPRFDYMSFGLNWGVAYDLPNATWILNHLHGFAKHPIPLAAWHRRSRRNLYKEIETLMDNMGYNGRDCILRALCESRQYFRKEKMSMIGEMLRTIFSLPKQRLYTRELREHSDIAVYDQAYREARSIARCEEEYHQCGFSLLELAFGKYSKPPKGYYEYH